MRAITPDVVVIGSGINGLAAATIMAEKGLKVRVYEEHNVVGGAVRSTYNTLEGFSHDFGAAVFPLALASPFFEHVRITEKVEFLRPDISFAHPVARKESALVYRSLDRTVDELGGVGGRSWRKIWEPLLDEGPELINLLLASPLGLAERPLLGSALGATLLRYLAKMAGGLDKSSRVSDLLSGLAAHGNSSIMSPASAGIGLTLGLLAHTVGWPIVRGGSGAITDYLVQNLIELGTEFCVDQRVDDLRQVPAKAVFLNLSAHEAARVARHVFPIQFSRRLLRKRFGAGVSKVDFALSEGVPWSDTRLKLAVTLHLGGSVASISKGERSLSTGRESGGRFSLLNQPSVIDGSRAPGSGQTLWAYTHVPNGDDYNATEQVSRQIEELAPGFRDTILASSSTSARMLAATNRNFSGGDINAGKTSLRQILSRPTFSRTPWVTPVRGIYICSGATSPGAGVHGMAGYLAARLALARDFGISADSRDRPTELFS